MDSDQKINPRSLFVDFLVMGLATVAGGLVVHALTKPKTDEQLLAELMGNRAVNSLENPQ